MDDPFTELRYPAGKVPKKERQDSLSPTRRVNLAAIVPNIETQPDVPMKTESLQLDPQTAPATKEEVLTSKLWVF